jgi:hypothetical protein
MINKLDIYVCHQTLTTSSRETEKLAPLFELAVGQKLYHIL